MAEKNYVSYDTATFYAENGDALKITMLETGFELVYKDKNMIELKSGNITIHTTPDPKKK